MPCHGITMTRYVMWCPVHQAGQCAASRTVEVMRAEELLERLVLALEVVVAERRRWVARRWPASLLIVGKVDTK